MRITGTIKIVSPSVERLGQPLANALIQTMTRRGFDCDYKDLVILQERKADG